jgi:hypothetical protein
MKKAQNTTKYKICGPDESIDDNYPVSFREAVSIIRESDVGESIKDEFMDHYEGNKHGYDADLDAYFEDHAFDFARDNGWHIEEVTALDHAIELLKNASNEMTCFGAKTAEIDAFIREMERASK